MKTRNQLEKAINENLRPIITWDVEKYNSWLMLAKHDYEDDFYKCLWWHKEKGILRVLDYGNRDHCKATFDKERKKVMSQDTKKAKYLASNK